MNGRVRLPMKSGAKIFGILLLAAFAAWAACAALGIAGQRTLFFRDGRELLSDFWMPRTCADTGYRTDPDEKLPVFAGVKQSGWIDGEMHVAQHDRCYPATAVVPMRIFPRTWCGAWIWTAFVTLFLLASLCLIARSWWPLVLMASMPVLFNVERGNPIGIAAACCGFFLAGYRSERKGVRIAAALALSVAACLKISPALLGALYLRERDWRSVLWCAVFSSVLFFVPWIFVQDSFAAIPVMLGNAGANFMEYARAAEFGLVDIWRTVRVALHQDCMHLWPGCLAATRVSQALGLVAVGVGAWRRDLLLTVGGMLWAAGNMHYYGALYLLPVFVLTVGGSLHAARSESAPYPVFRILVPWFVILCPLQIVVAGHSVNAVFANLALMALMAGSFVRRRLVV